MQQTISLDSEQMSAATGSPIMRLSTLTPLEIPPIPANLFDTVHKQPPKRCCFGECKKKLSLTDFPCKCGKVHCSAHRPSEAHQCSFDYKKQHESHLLKTMSTAVIAGKVEKI